MGEAMLKIARFGMVCVALAGAFASAPALKAQQAKATPTAPVPAQILAAKKVFISYAGNPMGEPYQPYDQFYAALKSWGRYELVTAPSDADLVFEIRFTALALEGNKEFVIYPQLELAILDVKTHFRLWTLTEDVENARLQSNRDKNYNKAMTNLVEDVKKLTVPPEAEVPNK
jgi:hypothetical protein